MNKIFTILIICLLSGPTLLPGQDDAKELTKVRQDRERLIDLVMSLQNDYANTLRDYANLQNDYAKILKKKDAPDHSAKVAELQTKLTQALERLKNQNPDGGKPANHALLEQDLANLRNELHRERQELLVARARLLRLKQLEEQNETLKTQLTHEKSGQNKHAAEQKAMQGEKEALMTQLKESMAGLQKSETARKALVTRLDLLEKENLALKKKISSQDTQIAQLRTIEAEHQKTLVASAALKTENERLTALVTEGEKKLANLREHLAAEVKRTLDIPILIRAQEDLQKKLQENEKNTGELIEKNNELRLNREALELKIATTEESLSTMRTQLEKNKSALASVTKLKTEKDQLQNTLQMAKAELVKSMGDRQRLEAQLAESQKVALAVADLKQMNDALLEEQGLLNNRLQNTENTLKASHQLTDELQASVLTLTKEKANLATALSSNEAEIEKLRTDSIPKPQMAETLANLEREKKDLAAKLTQREVDLKQTRTELGRLQITTTVAQKELASLKRQQAQIDPIRYALGDTKIPQQQTRVLQQMNEVLKLFPNARFEIIGHTCDLGNASANLKLSQDRAQSLYDFLISQKLPKDRLKHRGVGHTQPLVPNTSEANRQLNRRVVVEILD